MSNIKYRTFQFFMFAGKAFLNWKEPFLIEGSNMGQKIGELFKVRGFKKILVVSGPHISVSGMLDPIYKGLEDNDVSFVLFNNVKRDPDISCIEEGYKMYVRERCEGILAIGGGSPLDCAKAIGARSARPNKDMLKMTGLFKVGRTTPYFVAVPTTAGTGSETTIAAVITDESQHRKLTVIDPFLKPDAAVLDASLTKGLPSHITAETGMDALTHAIEAYINRFSRPTAEYSEQAVSLIMDNLLRAYHDSEDETARKNMLKASFYAGAAFTRSFVGYVHALAHAIGGIYGISHGKANAIILPFVLESFGDSIYDRLARLSYLAGVEGETREEKAKGFIEKIRFMNDEMGIPRYLDIEPADIPKIIKWAMEEANPLYPVPRIWGEDEFKECLLRISGRRV